MAVLLYVCSDCQHSESREGSRTDLPPCPKCGKDHFSPATQYIIGATWDDVPHLTKAQKAALWASIPPHQRAARSAGIPTLGSGAIYPVLESELVVKDFEIPKHWPRGYGLDVGWNRTAAVWGAHDRESDIIYLYSHHYMGEQKPVHHAAAIKARGLWIPGRIDPAAHGRAQTDGEQLVKQYRETVYGDLVTGEMMLKNAEHAVEAGIYAVYERMVAGKLKVAASLVNWFQEFRLYHRDEKGQIVKKNDHLMDATRYLILSGVAHWVVEPPPSSGKREEEDEFGRRARTSTRWME